MAKKTIVARISIAGKPTGKVTYETKEDSFHGKQLARLVLDEFVGFTRNIAHDKNGKAESWVITYTDGDSELAFASLPNSFEVAVEIDGERVDTVSDAVSIARTNRMWDWLEERGWH